MFHGMIFVADTWLCIKQPVTLCGFLNSSNDDDEDDGSDRSNQIITNGSELTERSAFHHQKQDWMCQNMISSHFTHAVLQPAHKKKVNRRRHGTMIPCCLACALPFQLCQHYCRDPFFSHSILLAFVIRLLNVCVLCVPMT